MPTVYLLMNCDLGCEQEVITEMMKLPDLKEVSHVIGGYDVIVKLQSDSMERLKETITWKLRRIGKIRATLTMIVNEGQGTPRTL